MLLCFKLYKALIKNFNLILDFLCIINLSQKYFIEKHVQFNFLHAHFHCEHFQLIYQLIYHIE